MKRTLFVGLSALGVATVGAVGALLWRSANRFEPLPPGVVSRESLPAGIVGNGASTPTPAPKAITAKGAIAKPAARSASSLRPDPLEPALLAMREQRYDEALKMARASRLASRRAAKANPSSKNGNLAPRDMLRARKIEAFALARGGDLKGARATFSALVAEGKGSPEALAEATLRPASPVGDSAKPALIEDALYQRAICTQALGDTAKAKVEFHALMREYPKSPLMFAAMKRVARMNGGDIPKETEALWKRAMSIRSKASREQKRLASLCGPQCLSELLKRRGESVDVSALAREMGTSDEGTSLLSLRDAARRHGFGRAQGVRLTARGLSSQKLPLVAYLAPGHFVLVESIDSSSGAVTLWDPQREKPEHVLSKSDWEKAWGPGIALALEPEGLKPENLKPGNPKEPTTTASAR